MIVEIGHYALALALALALLRRCCRSGGRARRPRPRSVGATARSASSRSSRSLSRALVYAHLASDFSLLNVAENSQAPKPRDLQNLRRLGEPRRLDAAVGADPPSFGALVALFGRGLPPNLRANVARRAGADRAAFLAFILLTSNPFARLDPAPFEGRDLNPVLQDLGLAIHPPLLYLGYVGFSIVFSFAAAALIEGRIDAAWARFVRPFALIAWSFLTLGIAMGSYWAYYTLGWGGFWFWDPVENASLMPWLAGTAFVHSVAVMEKRDALEGLDDLPGDPRLFVFAARHFPRALRRSDLRARLRQRSARAACSSSPSSPSSSAARSRLFAWRAPLLKRGGLFAPISREGALVLNNLLLTTTCAGVLIGTLYPLALEQLTGEKITVGAPYLQHDLRRASC